MDPVAIDELGPALRHLAARYYLPSLLATTGMMMLVPTLPLYLGRQTASLTLVSVVLAASSVGGLVANVPSGLLIARFGERAGLLGGLALSAVGAAGLALGGGLWPAFAACLVVGAGRSARLLARQSYGRRMIGVSIRGRVMSLYGGIGRVALVLGPLAGGFLGEAIGFRGAFAVASGLFAAAIMPILLTGPGGDGRPAMMAGGRLGLSRLVRRHGKIIGLAGVGQTGVALVRVGRLTLVPLYGESIGLELRAVGVVVAIAGGLDLVLFPVAGMVMDRFGRLYAIVPSFLLMAGGLSVMPLAHSFEGLAAAVMLTGVGNGLGAGTMLTMSTDLAPAANPAEFLGALRLLADVGRLLGPVVVGVVADRLDLGASALVLAAVGIATAALFILAIGETRHVAPALPRS